MCKNHPCVSLIHEKITEVNIQEFIDQLMETFMMRRATSLLLNCLVLRKIF